MKNSKDTHTYEIFQLDSCYAGELANDRRDMGQLHVCIMIVDGSMNQNRSRFLRCSEEAVEKTDL